VKAGECMVVYEELSGLSVYSHAPVHQHPVSSMRVPEQSMTPPTERHSRQFSRGPFASGMRHPSSHPVPHVLPCQLHACSRAVNDTQFSRGPFASGMRHPSPHPVPHVLPLGSTTLSYNFITLIKTFSQPPQVSIIHPRFKPVPNSQPLG
jgi:hypothetical protein